MGLRLIMGPGAENYPSRLEELEARIARIERILVLPALRRAMTRRFHETRETIPEEVTTRAALAAAPIPYTPTSIVLDTFERAADAGA